MQKFKWDSDKAALNVRKHEVTFEVAALVFADPFALSAQDLKERRRYEQSYSL
jgi:uncharacterized DUF497 family protein